MRVAEKHLCLGYLLHQHGGILPGGGGVTSGIFGWGCSAGTLDPYTRARSK